MRSNAKTGLRSSKRKLHKKWNFPLSVQLIVLAALLAVPFITVFTSQEHMQLVNYADSVPTPHCLAAGGCPTTPTLNPISTPSSRAATPASAQSLTVAPTIPCSASVHSQAVGGGGIGGFFEEIFQFILKLLADLLELLGAGQITSPGTGTSPSVSPAPTGTGTIAPTAIPCNPAPSSPQPTSAHVTSEPTKPAPTSGNPTVTPGVSFSTLPPGSVLPSDAQCAAEVTKAAENRPGNTAKNNVNEYTGGYRPGNTLTVLNQYDPSAQARVDGNFTGTTKEILQWAACKWGIDQNIVFAQAQIESNWNQSTLGCSGGTTQSGLNGNACVGILQVKAGNIPPTFAGAWPYAWNSTSWNADFALAVRRACYEGKFTWLGNGYAAGNIWGCVGEWDTGDWLSSGANAYITQVQADYNAKAWLKPGF